MLIMERVLERASRLSRPIYLICSICLKMSWLVLLASWPSSASYTFAQSDNVTEKTTTGSTTKKPRWTIAIHGGAGGDLDRWTQQQRQVRIEGLRKALSTGTQMLEQSAKAIDVVEAVVRVLEDDPNFNAGRGAVLNEVGEYSLDASLMDGSDLSCGAIANVRKTRNPISLARGVRDKTPHVFLVGDEADVFGVQLGLPTENGEYFKTQEQIDSWQEWKKRQAAKKEATSR